MHTPVLLNEVIEALDPKPGDFMVDGTVDGGGHAAAIIEKILPDGKFLGLDWDGEMLKKTKEQFAIRNPQLINKKIFFVQSNYADLAKALLENKFGKADGLLLDLGFSSEQIEDSGRGFSFAESRKDEPLLMTYSDDREPLRDIISRIPEKELADIIYQFGGERRSRQIAKAIVEHRRRTKIMTAGDLADVVRSALPKSYERGRIDPATRTFQALRIYVNGEFENLHTILNALPDVMAKGGRVAIISFHSLEDGIVKNAFRDMAKADKAELIYKKPITASREEIRINPRSRSAKLRAIKLATSQ